MEIVLPCKKSVVEELVEGDLDVPARCSDLLAHFLPAEAPFVQRPHLSH